MLLILYPAYFAPVVFMPRYTSLGRTYNENVARYIHGQEVQYGAIRQHKEGIVKETEKPQAPPGPFSDYRGKHGSCSRYT
jgi:hypothetical protein